MMGFNFRFPSGIFRCSKCKEPIDPHDEPRYETDDKGAIVAVTCPDCASRPNKLAVPR